MAMLSEEEKARRAANRRRKAALAAEEDAIRWDDKQREWQANGTPLTRTEGEAGVACRGCGLPIIDGLGKFPPLKEMTDKEREDHEFAETDFRRRHPDCHAHRWSVSGSRTTHCGWCCPPPPLSDEQIETIAAILVRVSRSNPAELDSWRLTLTCDHVIDKTQLSSNTHWSGSTAGCPTCGQTRGIVTAEKLPPSGVRHAAEHRRLTVELEQARSEHTRLQGKADAARRRIEKLEGRLSALGPVPDED